MISKGDVVLYTLSGPDALAINRRRTNGGSIAARMKIRTTVETQEPGGKAMMQGWPEGAQAHIGNSAAEGKQYPAIVVEDWAGMKDPLASEPDNPAVNLQVFLDGNDVFWATSRKEDSNKVPAHGTWQRRG